MLSQATGYDDLKPELKEQDERVKSLESELLDAVERGDQRNTDQLAGKLGNEVKSLLEQVKTEVCRRRDVVTTLSAQRRAQRRLATTSWPVLRTVIPTDSPRYTLACRSWRPSTTSRQRSK